MKKPFGHLQGAFRAMAVTAWNARTERVKTRGHGWKLRYKNFEEFFKTFGKIIPRSGRR